MAIRTKEVSGIGRQCPDSLGRCGASDLKLDGDDVAIGKTVAEALGLGSHIVAASDVFPDEVAESAPQRTCTESAYGALETTFYIRSVR
jgi:hypothetical protein